MKANLLDLYNQGRDIKQAMKDSYLSMKDIESLLGIDGLSYDDTCILADVSTIILNQQEMDRILYDEA